MEKKDRLFFIILGLFLTTIILYFFNIPFKEIVLMVGLAIFSIASIFRFLKWRDKEYLNINFFRKRGIKENG